MAHDIFVSYSVKDKEVAEASCAFVESAGFRCWMSPRDATAGTPWAAALVKAIQSSRAVLLIFSPRSNESEHVFREVSAAADAGIPILPFRVEEATPSKELGYYIRRAHWLDATVPPLEAHLPILADAVRRLLEATPAPPASESSGGAPRPARRRPLAGALQSGRGRALAAAALLVLVLGGFVAAWLQRSGTLTIESEPSDAAATVDGAPAGSTPLAVPLAAGSHGIIVRRAGFKDWSKVVEVARGEKASYSLQLVVADARDAAAVNLLARALGIKLQEFALPEPKRAPPEGEPLELIVPRGDVRPTDVSTLVMDVDSERVEPSGVIALRRGAHTLWETPFDPLTSMYEVHVPQEVRDAIRAGESITWGWWPKAGPPVTLTLKTVSDEVTPLFADIDRRLAQQPEGVRSHLRLQGLLDRQLYTGAFLEARALTSTDPADLRAGAVMEHALSKSGGGKLRLVSRMQGELRIAPEADRARVFGPTSAAMER